MHLEAAIERVWRLYSSEFGDAFGSHDCVNLAAGMWRVWTRTWRQWMDGAVGAETDFNC